MGFIQEFKAFIMRGSVLDLAVGVIIGAAFGKIVTSLVNDVLMPPIGLLVGGVNFTGLKLMIKAAGVDAAGKATDPVFLNYGNFIQEIVQFLIIAFAIFLVIKAVNALQRKQEAAPAAPTKTEELLTEIRDSLKK
ncbi:MAG TPA: large-conductance mechanosensitive channel protein MscL [Candidatus Kapabacteria bacterium]|nr:large-conductance mechanosensitive channel protein MscL [Candidatus Kapabacteria bacterium]